MIRSFRRLLRPGHCRPLPRLCLFFFFLPCEGHAPSMCWRLLESEVVNNFRPHTHAPHAKITLIKTEPKNGGPVREAECLHNYPSEHNVQQQQQQQQHRRAEEYIVGTLIRPIIGSRWLSEEDALALPDVRSLWGQPTTVDSDHHYHPHRGGSGSGRFVCSDWGSNFSFAL
uniref:Secreted peptide n=1 Tax=Anopheles braziliensis TaxID=58242 RepID=A0A2M3ZLL1_9DIPT